MAEVIGVFSVIITLTGLLYQIRRSYAQNKTKVIDSFEADLKDFASNILGWYNQINSFTTPLLTDLKLGRLTVKKQKEYSTLLNTIKRSDIYFSKCQQFIDKGLKRYEKKKILSSGQVKASIQQLAASYNRFSKLVFNHKDRLGYLLWQWKGMSSLNKQLEVHRIEDDLEKIETYKDAVVSVLNIEVKQ